MVTLENKQFRNYGTGPTFVYDVIRNGAKIGLVLKAAHAFAKWRFIDLASETRAQFTSKASLISHLEAQS